MLSIGHGSKALLLFWVQLVHAAHQQGVLTDGIQENVGFGFEIGGVQSNQQLAALVRAEVHQRRQVVLCPDPARLESSGSDCLGLPQH